MEACAMINPETTRDIPDQTGKRAIVSAANSGIGKHTAMELARAGAEVAIAWRGVGESVTNRPVKRTVHHSDGSTDGTSPVSPRRIELYMGSQGRWPDEEKAGIVIESFAPDTVVTQLAQRHGCRAQQGPPGVRPAFAGLFRAATY
jgi:NAD(P)-dependent dehydrogenase (short-subunit alcohol dehydrogenase family)